MFGSKHTTRLGKGWRLAIRLLAVTALGATSLVVIATPAQAAPPNPGIIRNWKTGRCLDSNWDGAVYTLGCNGGDYQKWKVEYFSLSKYQIKNVATGRCINQDGWGEVYTSPC